MRKFYFLALLLLFSARGWSQTNGDYRSNATSFNWNDETKWQVYTTATTPGSWITATSKPGSSSDVFIEAGHTVTLTGDEACRDLNLNTANEMRLNLVAQKLSINGKLRAYTGAAPGAKTGSLSTNANWITSTTGKIDVVGNSRALTVSTEWGAGSYNPYDIQINLNSGQVATVGTNIRARSWNVVNGTLESSLSSTSIYVEGDFFIGVNGIFSSNSSGDNVFQKTASTVGGNLIVNGTLRLLGSDPKIAMSSILFNGIVEYTRTGNQSFAISSNGGATPSLYNNVFISGTTTSSTPVKSISIPITMEGTLTIAGLAALSTNDNLTLKSTATSTGRIAQITSTATTPITGNVIAERFIAGGTNNTATNTYRRAFRFLAHPFNNNIALSQLNNSAVEGYDIDITGTGGSANGFTPTGSNNPSAFWYDPTAGSDAEDANGAGWKAFTNTNGVAPNSWAKGQGIRVFVRGKKGEGLSGAADYTQSEVTLDMIGTLNVGNQTINLTTAGPSIYQLIGNPYASPINLKTLGRTNVGNAYYVWNLGLGGGKGGYTTVDLSNSTPYILPAYSSFFATVTALNTTANILFKESDKTGDAPTSILFRTADAQGALKLQLKTGDILWDEFVLNNNADALASQDAYDATKLYNPDANLYSLIAGDKELAIDYRNIQPNEVVRLAMYANAKRNYTIHVDDAGITSTKSVYLVDKFTNQRTLLLQGVDYNFTVNDDAASQGENRFELEFVLNTTLPITFSNLKAYQKGTGIQVEWQAATEAAGSKYYVERSANGISFAAIGSVNVKSGLATFNNYTIYDASPFIGNSFYRIQSIDPSGQIRRSAVVKVALGKLSPGFAVYPNPVKDNRLNIQLNNLKAGKYNVTLINSRGQQVYVTNMNHAGGSVNYNLQVPSLPRGNYQLSIRSGGILLTQKVAFQ